MEKYKHEQTIKISYFTYNTFQIQRLRLNIKINIQF